VIHLPKEVDMAIKLYSVTQHNTWCNPGMWIATNNLNKVIWIQQNPQNGLTRTYFDEDRQVFDPNEYLEVKFVGEFDSEFDII
jgi:hypothetical protein